MNCTRNRWLFAAIAFGIGLAPARAIEPRFVPAGSEMVVEIGLKQIRQSQLFTANKDLMGHARAAVKKRLDDSPIGQYFAKAGLDVLNDVDSLTIATDTSKQPGGVFIVAEGRFNPEKCIEVALAASALNGDVVNVKKTDGAKIIEILPKNKDANVVVAFVGDSQALVGTSRQQVDAAIARINEKETPEMSPAFQSLINATKEKQALSIIATGIGLRKSAEAAEKPSKNIVDIVQHIDGLAFTIGVAQDARVRCAITAKSKEDAEKLGALVNVTLDGIRQAFRAIQERQPEARAYVQMTDALKVQSKGASVILEVQATEDQVNRIAAAIMGKTGQPSR